MSDDNVRLRFEILDDGDVIDTREFDRDVVKIGSMANCHLRLDRPGVARVHAAVERTGDGGVGLLDLGSSEGTYVNGDAVTKTGLEDGDELRFGETRVRMRLVDVGDRDPSAAESDGARSHLPESPAGAESDETVITEHDRQVEPYTLEGYYDQHGNYIPGYYDEDGDYHHGYGYWDEQGRWRVASGYYNPRGEWIATDEPVRAVAETDGDDADRSAPIWEKTSDREVYTDAFFADCGGDTLEIAHLWGDHVLSVTSFDEARTVTFAPDQRGDFRVGEETADRPTPLVRFNSQWLLAVTPAMRGHVRRGDEQSSLRSLIESGAGRPSPHRPDTYLIPLGPETSARIEIDGNTFLVHFSSMPAVDRGALSFDKTPLRYQGLSAAVHVLFLLAAMLLPADAGDLSIDQYSDRNRFAGMVVKPDQKKKTKKPSWMNDSTEQKSAKHAGEETKAGSEESTDENGEMQIKGPPDNEDTQIAEARDREIAMDAAAMRAFSRDQVASDFASADQAIGSSARDAIGHLDGDSAGDSSGFGGLGLRGDGRPGGGGNSDDTVGIHEIGDELTGSPPEGEGVPEGDLGENDETEPTVVQGPTEIPPVLDRKTIRRVVRQHRREIKYCYERELQQNNSLEGRVVVNFTIAPSGDVVSAVVSESTLNNAAVEQCMQKKIRHWTFPGVDSDRMATVNYPFNLSPK